MPEKNMIGIFHEGEYKLIKEKDRGKYGTAEILTGVTDKASLYKYRIDKQGKLTQDEIKAIETQADTKITRDITEQRKIWDRGNTPRVERVVVGQEEVFPWEDSIGKDGDRDKAKGTWIYEAKKKARAKKTKGLFDTIEDEVQPFFSLDGSNDVAVFLSKYGPGTKVLTPVQ